MLFVLRKIVKSFSRPISISIIICLPLTSYCHMGCDELVTILMFVQIDVEAPFAAAFRGSPGWAWVSNVVGVGAAFGILTSLLVAMLGQARYLCVIGRSGVVPAWFARVHPRTATPVNASAALGLLTAAIALFTDLHVLLNLVSIGTLFVFYMVANAVIFRRYVAPGGGYGALPWPTLAFLAAFSALSLLFTLVWQFAPPGVGKGVMLGACTAAGVGTVQAFVCLVPQARKPELWGVPLMPWVPTVSIFLNLFLLGSLDRPSYIRFGVFSAAAVAVYLLYSVHASFDAEGEGLLVLEKNGEIEISAEGVDHGNELKV